MKFCISLFFSLLLASSSYAAVIIDFADFDNEAIEGSTNNPFVYSVGTVSGIDLEMVLTASSPDGDTFANWDTRGEGLGWEDQTGQYTSWIDNYSDATEEVTITFREAATHTEASVNLGSTGLTLGEVRDGQALINGVAYSKAVGVVALANAQDVFTISAVAEDGPGNNRFTLDTIDIDSATVIPEPSASAMVMLALGAALALRRRRRGIGVA
jgi:hypothetical protein